MRGPSRLAAALLWTSVLSMTIACSSGAREERPRCAQCGMFADAAPQWAARADADETTLRFDSPKCLFRYHAAHPDTLMRLRVRGYYSHEELDAEAGVYVRGSDLQSPMGADLVPLSDADAAAEFIEGHGGEAVSYGEIDAALLRGLDP